MMRHLFLEDTWGTLSRRLPAVIKRSLKSLGPRVCKPGTQPFIMLLRVYFGQVNSMGGGGLNSPEKHSAVVSSLHMTKLSRGQAFLHSHIRY